MADIAAIFHWPLREMETMTIADIAIWRDHAARRSGAAE